MQHSLSIEPTVVQSLRALMDTGERLNEHDAVALMQQTYRAFVHDNSSRFGELFSHLLDSDAPLVFHCTAGKDRTGFAAALILLALGVPRPVVMEDFLLTNSLYRRAGPSVHSDVPIEVMEVIWKVRGEFLEAALQVVDADCGGVDNYLARIGIGASQRSSTCICRPDPNIGPPARRAASPELARAGDGSARRSPRPAVAPPRTRAR